MCPSRHARVAVGPQCALLLDVRAITVALLVCAAATAEQPKLRLYSEVGAIRSGEKLLWEDPGAVERKSLQYGVGGERLAPRRPFTFLEEETVGASPKVLVRDGAGRKWSVKFGNEVRPDVFGSRMAWAVGYYAEPTYYVAHGRIRKAVAGKDLEKHIDAAGRFRHARFQLRSKVPEFLTDVGWSWTENPFAGTRELSGLKVLMMLLSNWDAKDIRDAGQGSNTAIYRAGNRYLFFVPDWGASMGDWGWGPTRLMKHFTHSKWDCSDFYKQSRKFVKVEDDGDFDWSYRGTHRGSLGEGISSADVRWLMGYLGRLSDGQIRTGLLASGATAAEAACFTAALRMRVRHLAAIARMAPSDPRAARPKSTSSVPAIFRRG
jgi:hypothetical protein